MQERYFGTVRPTGDLSDWVTTSKCVFAMKLLRSCFLSPGLQTRNRAARGKKQPPDAVSISHQASAKLFFRTCHLERCVTRKQRNPGDPEDPRLVVDILQQLGSKQERESHSCKVSTSPAPSPQRPSENTYAHQIMQACILRSDDMHENAQDRT